MVATCARGALETTESPRPALAGGELELTVRYGRHMIAFRAAAQFGPVNRDAVKAGNGVYTTVCGGVCTAVNRGVFTCVRILMQTYLRLPPAFPTLGHPTMGTLRLPT